MSLLTEINVQGYPRKPDTRSRVTCNGSAADKAPPGVAAATEMPVLTFLLSFCFLLSTEAFYFHMGEREEKCIIEDIPGDTLVTGRSGMPAERGARAATSLRLPTLDVGAVRQRATLHGFLLR